MPGNGKIGGRGRGPKGFGCGSHLWDVRGKGGRCREGAAEAILQRGSSGEGSGLR